jgi:hypothetical protein
MSKINIYITYILNIIFKPSLAFQKILQEQDLKFPFIIVLINGILAGVYVYFGTSAITPAIRNTSIFSPVIFLGIWTITGWLLNGTCKRLKGTGTFKNLLLTTGLAYIIPILSFLISFFLINIIGIGPLFSTIVRLLLQVWFLSVFIIAIKETHDFSLGKAIGSIVILVLYIMGVMLIVMLVSHFFTRSIPLK